MKLDISEFEFSCYWHNFTCEKNQECETCEHQPAPEDKPNGKAAPVKITWDVNFMGTYPECPSCGEMPYTCDRCFFCGQPFIQEDEKLQEYVKPPEEVRLNCFMCGGINTLVGVRAKINGHFHGSCEQCGARVIE